MRIDLGDVEVDVDDAGDRGGPATIWTHGLTGSRASEAEAPLVDWAQVGGRVVRYDARGHGRSGASADPDAYRWDRLAGDLLMLADRLGIDRFVAAGASMGCATSLFAALAAPARVRGLVLAIPPTAWATRKAQVETYSKLAHVIEKYGVERVIAAGAVAVQERPAPYRDDPHYEARWERRLRGLDRATVPTVYRGAARSDLPEPSRLATIDVPTLVLAWAGDAGHPVSTAERLAEVLPAAELHVASTPDELARWTALVRDFVAAAA